MKTKLIMTCVAAALTLTAISPAHAISEAYRKQLQKEHKTMNDDAHGKHVAPTKNGGLQTFSDNVIEVQADSKCNVKKVNGFAPKGIKHVKADMAQVKTAMGATISVLKNKDGSCDMTWTNEDNQSGVLTRQ